MDIFSLKSVQGFLHARIASLPKRGRGEASRMAKHLGVSSTLMSQILSGDRQLSLEQGELLADYLGLRSLETDCLLFQIQFERAGTKRLRDYWQTKLEKVRTDSRVLAHRVTPKKVLSETERAVFYSSPIYSAVRLYASTAPEGRTLEQIAGRFELSRAKVARVVDSLLEASLLEANGNYLKMGVQSTHLESGSPHLMKHHANWRIKAMQYAEDLDEAELMFTSPASISREDFDRLREKMVLFIKDFLAQAHASPAEEVACFNLDFFWVRK